VASGREVLNVQILPGMRQDVDDTLLPPGTPRYLQNVRCYQQGRLDKRPGTRLIFNTNLPGHRGNWLSQQGGRAVVGTQDNGLLRLVYEIGCQESEGDVARWTSMGAHGAIVPVRRFGISPQASTGLKHVSSVKVGNLLYVAYTESAGAGTTTHLQVVTLDGTVLRATKITNATNSRLLYINSVVYFIYRDPSSAGSDDIEAAVVNQDDASLGTPVTIETAGGGTFDVAPLEGSSTDWLLASTTSPTTITVRRMTGTTSTANTNITTVGVPSLVGIIGDTTSGRVLVGWVEDALDVKVSVRNSTTLALVATTTLDTKDVNETYRYQLSFVRMYAGTGWLVLWGGTETTSSPTLGHGFFSYCRIDNAGVATSVSIVTNFGLASKPFTNTDPDVERGSTYVWAHTQGDSTLWRTQAAHYLLELDGAGTASTWNAASLSAISYDHVATYGPSTSFMSQLPTVESFGSGMYAAPLNWQDPSGLSGVDVAVFTAATRQDSVRAAHRFAAERSGALVVSGGCMYEHTGARSPAQAGFIVENGFAYDPELAVALRAGGSLTSGQEYTWVAVYRWTDALGRIHRSAPSPPVTATPSAGNLSVTLRGPIIRASGRLNAQIVEPEIEVYRSWLGGPYYYVTSAAAGLSTTNSVSIIDTFADATVEAAPALYTDQGFMPTDPPSGARLWCDGGTRVFCVGWRENVVQFSKLLIPTAPIEFVDDDIFRIFLPEPITAIWWLDGALVIFCRNGVYTVTGDGPSDQGVGQYGDPRRLPVAVSCDDARSLVEVPQGLMYKGGGTIWLMPRGFAPPIPIGDAIARYLESYPYVVSAAVTYMSGSEGTARNVHFVIAPGDTDAAGSPIVAVYDLELGSWSIDQIGGPAIGAATAIGGEFWWVAGSWSAPIGSDRPVRRFSSNEVQDYDTVGASLWIESRVELGYIRPFGLLGWGTVPHVQVFGYVPGVCELTLSGTINDYPFQSATHEFASTDFASYLEHAFETAPCNSLQLSFTDAMVDVPTAGYSIRGLALEVQPEKGLRRVATDSTERF
jgi:hypothetical protein